MKPAEKMSSAMMMHIVMISALPRAASVAGRFIGSPSG